MHYGICATTTLNLEKLLFAREKKKPINLYQGATSKECYEVDNDFRNGLGFYGDATRKNTFATNGDDLFRPILEESLRAILVLAKVESAYSNDYHLLLTRVETT